MNIFLEYILIQRYVLTVLGCMPNTGFRMKKKNRQIKEISPGLMITVDYERNFSRLHAYVKTYIQPVRVV